MGNAAGTNCETTAAACTRPCAANRLSSRSVCRRKSSRSNRDRRKTVRTLETARRMCASIPTRFRPGRQRRIRSTRREMIRQVWDPSAANQNYPGAVRAAPHPRDTPARSHCACRKQRGATRLRLAIPFRPTEHRQRPRRGSRTQANRVATEFPRTSSGKPTNRLDAPKGLDGRGPRMRCSPNLHRSTASGRGSPRQVRTAGTPDSSRDMRRSRRQGLTRCVPRIRCPSQKFRSPSAACPASQFRREFRPCAEHMKESAAGVEPDG